ncbi:hypothetical protein MASR1M45_06990 [Candidatus Kapaibacterium sp.]
MKKFLLLFLVILAVSCSENNDTPIVDGNNQADKVQTKSESEFLRIQDSILKNYSSAVKLINQIDGELSKLAKTPNLNESYNYELDILKKIDYLSFQLKTNNEVIDKLQGKLKRLTKENNEFKEKFIVLENIIAEKDEIIANQNIRISDLEKELNITKAERDVALVEKQQFEQLAQEKEIQKNTAFYVIGKEKNLKQDNIIKMEGEGFLGIGGKYVPSTEADLKYFTKIDIYKDTLIPLPSNSKVAEIVSTHNKRMIEYHNPASGSDMLKIKSPESFWRTDKLLIIIVEDK